MRFGISLLLRIGFLLALGNGVVRATPTARTVSTSRQFIVYGVTAPLRSAVAEVAEQSKATVLNVLQQRDEWKIPILLNLQFPQANVPDIPATAFRFSQTGSGLKIQLDLTVTTDFQPVALRRQLVRLVLLEMAYRNSADLPAGSYYVEPPDWLVEGILAADPHQDRAAMLAAVAPLVTNDATVSLDQFFHQKLAQLDSPGELLYRGYAFAFLQLLLQDQGGPMRLTSYITNLSRTSADPVADLRVFFPVLAAGPALDALWKTSLASLKLRHYELLTPAETEHRLGELVGGEKAASSASGTDLARFIKRKISKKEAAQLRQLGQRLEFLATESNPIVRSVVVQYQRIVERLIRRDSRGLQSKLSAVAKQRQQLASRANDIDDYMNWFEVTNSGSTSGAFTPYLRAAARSEESQTRRRDPLSVYLDALEEQFQGP